MHRSTRSTVLLAVIAALIAVVAVAGIATAATPDVDAAAKKKKKPLFTSKQKKEINKLIAKKIAAIPPVTIPTIPAGPAAYTATNAAIVSLDSDLTEYQTVVSKVLPAGKHVISGHVNGFYYTDAVADEAVLTCRTKLNGTTLETVQAGNDAGIFLILLTGATLNMSFDFTTDTAAASTLLVECAAGYDSPGANQGVVVNPGASKFTAVTVGSIG